MSGVRRERGFAKWRHALTPLALVALIAAVAMPDVTLPRNTFNYIVTFDITQSMDVEDVVLGGAPVSRLKFAQVAMRDALERLPCGSKVGWSVFTGQRVLLLMAPVEVCGNYDALLVSLDGIDGRMRWTNWSRIAEGGVYSAVRVAKDVGGGAAIAFVTDGQEAPPLLASRPLMEGINAARIRGWLIGVGGDQPAAIPKTDANGNRIGVWQADDVIQVPPTPGSSVAAQTHEELSELRGEYLASVARQTGLDYRRLLNVTSFGDALLEARFARREPVPTDLRWCPALLALLLLVARFMPDAVLAWPRAWRKRFQTIALRIAPAFNGRPTRVD
ncbi:VWA domain-containing protein [Paraburkholderia youngii]|uniref:VWA domain-containing protein n=1 Tax=Paraburkholderia youngii TaxID=2782701 RepID=UPI0015914912|nr:VWA domain-containing protein [Paraburkholderia youngii]NUX52869.1 VWA domain-containing protein [Paraburkholderia youngii]